MSEHLRVGLLGAGAVVREIHGPGYAACPDAVLQGIWSRDLRRAQRLGKDFGVAEVFDTHEALIASDTIDAVSVCTPPFTHRPLTELAVAAGKHVLLEKPVAHTLGDVAALSQLAAEAEVTVQVVHNERFMELHEALRELVQRRTVGEVTAIVTFTSTTGPDDWTGGAGWPKRSAEAGGGVLIDLAVHKVDLISWLTGQEIVSASPAMLKPTDFAREGDVEWSGAVVLELSEGATATVSASWLGPPDTMLVIVAGTAGTIQADGATGRLVLTDQDGPVEHHHVAPWSAEDRSPIDMVSHFVTRCLRKHETDPFEQAIWDAGTRWVLTAYEYANTRREGHDAPVADCN